MLSKFCLGERSLSFGKYVFGRNRNAEGTADSLLEWSWTGAKKKLFFNFLIKDKRFRYYRTWPKCPVIYSFGEFHFTRKTAKTNSRIDPGTSCERWRCHYKAGCFIMEKTIWQRRHACLMGNAGLETLTLSGNLARMNF